MSLFVVPAPVLCPTALRPSPRRRVAPQDRDVRSGPTGGAGDVPGNPGRGHFDHGPS